MCHPRAYCNYDTSDDTDSWLNYLSCSSLIISVAKVLLFFESTKDKNAFFADCIKRVYFDTKDGIFCKKVWKYGKKAVPLQGLTTRL